MKLNHLNLTVADAIAAGSFLAKYFGLKPGDGVKMSSRFAVLYDDEGLVLTLIQAEAGEPVRYPASFHIGFIQESPDKVNELHRRLISDGFEVEAPHKAHGAWTFYFTAPGGFTIEVLC